MYNASRSAARGRKPNRTLLLHTNNIFVRFPQRRGKVETGLVLLFRSASYFKADCVLQAFLLQSEKVPECLCSCSSTTPCDIYSHYVAPGNSCVWAHQNPLTLFSQRKGVWVVKHSCVPETCHFNVLLLCFSKEATIQKIPSAHPLKCKNLPSS